MPVLDHLAPSDSASCVPNELLFGRSEAMRDVRDKLAKVSRTNVAVLVTGESGTGKEVVARYLHSVSPRCDAAFVRVNCPAIPESLFESELFGYEQGAFTGAAADKPGLVDAARGGTLFFDGIGELELALQSKLLQLLQDNEFTRVGGRETLRADVRFVCAATRPLEDEVHAGTFRRDLLYRINVVTVQLPPLRERRDDIMELADFFLGLYAAEFGTIPVPFSPDIRELLLYSTWPGNIRQLQNVVKRYAIFGTEDAVVSELRSRPLGADLSARSDGEVYLKEIARQAAMEAERGVILEVLCANRWNRRKAAQALHISYRSLLMKMKQSGLPQKRPQTATLPIEARQ
ncbi:MAG: sigma-54 dependent transcriptional regulator [Bryobacteraceae bacterium]